MIRLQKFLAEAGIASRRASEQVIVEGRVEVNGEKVSELGRKIDPLHDHVRVDGKPLRAKRKIYLALNKAGQRFTDCCPKNGDICIRSDVWILTVRDCFF